MGVSVTKEMVDDPRVQLEEIYVEPIIIPETWKAEHLDELIRLVEHCPAGPTTNDTRKTDPYMFFGMVGMPRAFMEFVVSDSKTPGEAIVMRMVYVTLREMISGPEAEVTQELINRMWTTFKEVRLFAEQVYHTAGEEPVPLFWRHPCKIIIEQWGTKRRPVTHIRSRIAIPGVDLHEYHSETLG